MIVIANLLVLYVFPVINSFVFHIAKNISPLNLYIKAFFDNFKEDILSYTLSQWKDEDLKGESYNQWNINRYYGLLYLLILIRIDYDRIGNYKDWSYFVNKYDLIEYKKCLACSNISLDISLNIFNLPIVNDSFNYGIELASIENTFIIDENNSNNSQLNYLELLKENVCINNII